MNGDVGSAPQLIFEAHGYSYRRLSSFLGQDFQGLSQAARTARQQGHISSLMATKLCRLDTAFSLLRHVSSVKNDRLFVQLDNELGGSSMAVAGSSPSSSATTACACTGPPALSLRVAHLEGLVAHAIAGVDLALSREAGIPPLPAAAISFDKIDAMTEVVGSDLATGSDVGDPRDSGLSTDVDDTAYVTIETNQNLGDVGTGIICVDACGADADVPGGPVGAAAPLSRAPADGDFLDSLAALRGKF
eukprot:CAMPEP_0117619434 /NCGR_PEP_ID=MMETSP0784-20121206/86614_1 /TAXON_ID=39447 /ORGANISM="" /LENGTH=246 /DNA_ID=CAMNT_0005423323 /DNA_START=109 /DNA_END=846 /DNA_ORIENTATION=+